VLTELQTKKLSRYFRVYDIDDDGRIGPADFARVIENVRALHGFTSDSEEHRRLAAGYAARWDGIAESADVDQDGGIDLQEWLTYWDGVLADDARYEEEVRTLEARFFEIFDIDEDGAIGPDEFCNFFGVYGLSAALARQIFMDIDLDGDGEMSHEELMTMAREFYRGDDPDAPGNRLFGPYE